MPLMFGTKGETYEIKRITGNAETKKHLTDLGFNVGGKVTIVNTIEGGLIVTVKETRVALDKTLALRIEI